MVYIGSVYNADIDREIGVYFQFLTLKVIVRLKNSGRYFVGLFLH